MGCASSSKDHYNPAEDSSADSLTDAASSDDRAVDHIRSKQLKEKKLRKRGKLRSQIQQLLATQQSSNKFESPQQGDQKDGASIARPDGVLRVRTRLLSPEQIAQCQNSFWGLGKAKWRESIDRLHWYGGVMVYDMCLHRGNGLKKEIGYISSMYDSWRFASSEMGFKSTAGSWCGLHFLAMQHPGNDFLNGLFRHLLQGNRALVAKSFSPFGSGSMNEVSMSEFNAMPKRLCFVTEYSGEDAKKSPNIGYERHMPGIKRKTMGAYVGRFIHEFYAAVGVRLKSIPPEADEQVECRLLSQEEQSKSTVGQRFWKPKQQPVTSPQSSAPASGENCDGVGNVEEEEQEEVCVEPIAEVQTEWTLGWPPPRQTVLEAAAVLQQQLSRMEPSRDGNTRTMVVLINKLLCECGYSPVLLDWPDGAAVLTHAEWVELLDKGMAAWLSMLQDVAELHRQDDELAEKNAQQFEIDRASAIRQEEERQKMLKYDQMKVLRIETVKKRLPLQERRRPKFYAGMEANVNIPPRELFECPLPMSYLQENAWFTN